MEIVAHKGSWYVEFEGPRGRQRKSTGFPAIAETWKLASAKAIEILRDPAQQDLFSAPEGPSAKMVGNLGDLADRFSREERFPTEETRRGYLAHLRSLLAVRLPEGGTVGQTSLRRFSEPGVYSWLCSVAGVLEKLSPRPSWKTRRHRISALMRLLRWAGPERAGLIPAPPRAPVVPKIRDRDGEPVSDAEAGVRDRYLEPDEFWAAMDALEKHLMQHLPREEVLGKLGYPIWAVSTGAHLRNCRTLRGELVRFEPRPLYEMVNTKGKKRRGPFEMPDPAAELISKLVAIRGRNFAQHERVFPPWADCSCAHAMRTAAALSGIEPFRMIDLRRTFAVWLCRAGVPKAEVAHLMGHSSTKMLDAVYARWWTPLATAPKPRDVIKARPKVTLVELRAISENPEDA